MTAQKRIQVGTIVSITGLVVLFVTTLATGFVGYGQLRGEVESVANIAHGADARSIENGKVISKIDGKLDMILEHVKR